ncbi:MAG TPA: signal peptide peptidase SppA [Spirochaetota bacterium]|nr:signal peptide peptidase SppA [Spirochaetota bacterium]HRZ26265.1 signal peptide peptidase SppA [Spirochaetota bacterium]HSA15213.1 signal peptide peptidase SppA [Spirochaetota bacterium]
MDRNRKILISILAMLVLTAVIAIVHVSLTIQEEKSFSLSVNVPQFGPGVGIARVEGPIGFSVDKSPFSMARGSEDLINRLDDLEKDSNIKAVVLRINSPGGTVAATQEIYQKIWKLRKKNIVVVASMGEVAASGGYYIASACNHIIANQGTLTGSIGVIAASPNLKGLLDRFGIKMNVIKSGKFKDSMAFHREMRDDERELIQQLIDISYEKFIKDIALGRNMNESDIRPVADGRVMTGETAMKYKLIDGIGTFEDAVDRARQLAELPASSPVYDEMKTPLEQLLFSVNGMFRGNGLIQNGLSMDDYYRLEYRLLP